MLHFGVELRHLHIGAKRPVKSGLFEVVGVGVTDRRLIRLNSARV